MKRRQIVWILVVVFSITVSVAVAGNKNGGSSGGQQGTGGNDSSEINPVRERIQDREMVNENNCDHDPAQSRDRTQVREWENNEDEQEQNNQTQDGKLYKWIYRFRNRIKKYEDQDIPE
jgi:hypothetical protein